MATQKVDPDQIRAELAANASVHQLTIAEHVHLSDLQEQEKLYRDSTAEFDRSFEETSNLIAMAELTGFALERETFWANHLDQTREAERESLQQQHAKDLEDASEEKDESHRKQIETLQKQHQDELKRFDDDLSIAALAIGMPLGSDTSARPSSRLGEFLALVRSDVSISKTALEASDWQSTVEGRFQKLLDSSISKHNVDTATMPSTPEGRLEWFFDAFNNTRADLRAHEMSYQELKDKINIARIKIYGPSHVMSGSLAAQFEALYQDLRDDVSASQEKGATEVLTSILEALAAPSKAMRIRLDRTQSFEDRIHHFFQELSLYLDSRHEQERKVEAVLAKSAEEFSIFPYTSQSDIQSQLLAYIMEIKLKIEGLQAETRSIVDAVMDATDRIGLHQTSSKNPKIKVDVFIAEMESLYNMETKYNSKVVMRFLKSISKAYKLTGITFDPALRLREQVRGYFYNTTNIFLRNKYMKEECNTVFKAAFEQLGSPCNMDEPVEELLRSYVKEVQHRLELSRDSDPAPSGSKGLLGGVATHSEVELHTTYGMFIQNLGNEIIVCQNGHLNLLDPHSTFHGFQLSKEVGDMETAKKNFAVITKWLQQCSVKFGELVSLRAMHHKRSLDKIEEDMKLLAGISLTVSAYRKVFARYTDSEKRQQLMDEEARVMFQKIGNKVSGARQLFSDQFVVNLRHRALTRGLEEIMEESRGPQDD